MFVCAFILCLCVLCAGSGVAKELIPHPRGPTNYVKDQETEKAAKAQQRDIDR
jgi:hypothetical protein